MTDESRLDKIEQRLDRLEFIDKQRRKFEIDNSASRIRFSLGWLQRRRDRGEQLSSQELEDEQDFKYVLKQLDEIKK
jgi:hypothetical protein